MAIENITMFFSQKILIKKLEALSGIDVGKF